MQVPCPQSHDVEPSLSPMENQSGADVNDATMIELVVDGIGRSVPDDGGSLLGALRDRLGLRSAKDGCSPQGQCGCCTVLVDGSPRVACVTPLRRVAGRTITTFDGLDPVTSAGWCDAFTATGASQCGFCTPGIIVRLEGLRSKLPDASTADVHRALAAHLCRCTGWQTVVEAWSCHAAGGVEAWSCRAGGHAAESDRDWAAAARRAGLEGGSPQTVGPEVAAGRGGFAADSAPPDAVIAVPDGSGGWVVGATLEAARRAAGKVQGRRTTAPALPPLEVPDGEWALTLRTCWVEPGYLETDAAWCRPGGEPTSPLANGGAFGGKVSSPVPDAGRALADELGRPVLAVWSREDAVRWGPKRPPIAAGLRADGSGVMRAVRTPGLAEAIAAFAPNIVLEEVTVAGPPTSIALRGAGWMEAAILLAALGAKTSGDQSAWIEVRTPSGGVARARVGGGGIDVQVEAGAPLDPIVLRSYAIGAAHAGFSWVTSEALAVDRAGEVQDLTMRSFGIVKPDAFPHVEVTIVDSDAEPVNASDAVMAAVAAAVWVNRGCPPVWPAAAS